jgi:3-deoxy-manno-octulosonate cytidylyltransferase (CMP-KDO synthetase)
MSKAVGIIPARWASTRFPGKPLHLIAGKPLLRRVWERCRRARKLDSVIIATDDMRIASAAFSWGAEVALTSPRHRSGTDRVAEVAQKAKEFAYIINIQGDEPLVDPRLIDKLVETLQADGKIDIVTAAHPFSNVAEASSPHQVKVVVDLRGNALYFSRAPIPASRSGGFRTAESKPGRFVSLRPAEEGLRRARGNRPSLYLRHQGIYGFRREALLQFVKWKPSPLEQAEALEQLRPLENGVRVHVLVTKHGSPGVDTPQDAKTLAASLREASDKSAKHRARRVVQSATATGRRIVR